jgi:predicted outer membrane repeat protein
VDGDAAAPENGSKANPYTTLQDAFDEANNNAGTDYEIRIAEGVYTPDDDNKNQITGDDDGNSNTEHVDGDATESFTLTRDGVTIKGGYASGFGTRDPETYVTVLSGDVDGDDTTTPEGIVETVGDIAGSNSNHVLDLDGTSQQITTDTEIRGVTITGGQAGSGNGGGMLCDGGMNGCSPRLENVTLIGNQAGNGGGAYITADFGASSNPQITSARFENNQATNGGAVYNDGSGSGGTASPTFTDVVFTGNSASGGGGAIYNNGENGTASPTISRSVLTDNSTSGKGGAVYNHATAGAIIASSNPTITSTVIVENTATEGGAVANEATTSSMANPGDASPTLTNVTVVRNEAQDGGAVHTSTGANGSTAEPGIENTILWGNTATGSGNQAYSTGGGSTLSIDASIVEAGDTELFGSSAFSGGSDNLNCDPLFVDVANENVRLNWASPAIDAGDDGVVSPGTDRAGNPRIQGPTVDIGAYEGGVVPSSGSVSTLRVDASMTTSGASGATWTTAYGTLQAALAAVRNERAAGGTLSFDEVRIAEGQYYPDEGPGIPENKQDTSFVVTGSENGLQLRGGYPSGGGSRDVETYKTVLSGDINQDDDNKVGGVTPTAADIRGDENAHHVVVLDGTSSAMMGVTKIDGVTITAGDADGSAANKNNLGGGLYCNGAGSGNECSPTLRTVTFRGNSAANGGGIYHNGLNGGTTEPLITGAAFAGNDAVRGGGIYNNGDNGVSSPRIVSAVFANNSALSGGGLYNFGKFGGTSSPQVVNATFVGNDADGNGGAIHNNGANSGTSSPQITNTILWNNSAAGDGDEIYNNATSNDDPVLKHTIIQGGVNGSGVGGDDNIDDGDNLDQNPKLNGGSSLAGDDGQLATVDDSLSLAPGSPALDAGTNAPFSSEGVADDVTTDLSGGARTQDLNADDTPTVNMGAYESVEPRAPSLSMGTIVNATGTYVGYRVNPGAAETTVRVRLTAASGPVPDTLIIDRTLSGAVQKVTSATLRGLLTPGTTYRVEAEVTNAEGTSEKGPISFEPPPAPTLTEGGGPQEMAVRLTGGGGSFESIEKTLYVRPGGGGDYQERTLTSTEDGGFRGTIPASLITTTGVDYYVTFTGPNGSVVVPQGRESAARQAPLHLPVSFASFSPASLTDDLFQKKTYRMVSVPAAVNPKAALTETYGSYKTTKWRVLQWAASQGAYRGFPALDSTDLTAGNGFWLITEQGTPLSLGSGQTVDASAPRAVELEPGWNQVGTPFGFAVPWDTVRTGSGFTAAELDGPYRRGAEGYQTDVALQPWRGYFVFNATAETDTLLIPPVNAEKKTASSQRLATAKSSGRYTVRVTARSKAGPSTATVGLRSGANAGRDRYDIAKPPSVRPVPTVSVLQKAGKRSVPHAKSMKPTGGSGQTWTLRLHRPEREKSPSSVRLDWSAEGSLPEGQSRYVVDPSSETRVAPGKRFSLDKGETRRLKVIVGTERYAQKNTEAALQQYETALRGNYPNPFEKQTTLEYTLSRERAVTMQVYNVLGQQVETLVDETKRVGLHRVTWDGTNRYGERVGSGVYFVRMEAGSTTETQKVVLVR